MEIKAEIVLPTKELREDIPFFRLLTCFLKRLGIYTTPNS